MSTETSIPKGGFSSPRQGVIVRPGAGRQKTVEEEAKLGMSNDSTATRLRSTGCHPPGGLKTQSGEQKKRGGGADLQAEEKVRLGGTPDKYTSNQTDFGGDDEVSLKTDITAVGSDIGQVLGWVEEMKERLDMYAQKLEEMNEQMRSL